MRSFPAEFSAFLSPSGRRLLTSPQPDLARSFGRGTPFALLEGIVAPATAKAAVALLDGEMRAHMKPMRTPIDREWLAGMTTNYSERLGKTVRVKTASLNEPRSRASKAAAALGLAPMLRSASMHRFAEVVTGLRLEPRAGGQVICYEEGDYTGPHNDHHPEDAHLRDGYVDVQVMLTNEHVAGQLLVYEEGGYLSKAANIAQRAAVAVYRLPFWHYTTPLLAKPGHEADARRWLLLASFMLAA